MLTCGLEEHTHTEACYSTEDTLPDGDADDPETPADGDANAPETPASSDPGGDIPTSDPADPDTQAGGTLEVSLLYGDGKSQAEHPDGVDYYTHSTMAGVYPAGAQRSGCISDRPDRHPADLYGQERRQPDRRL